MKTTLPPRATGFRSRRVEIRKPEVVAGADESPSRRTLLSIPPIGAPPPYENSWILAEVRRRAPGFRLAANRIGRNRRRKRALVHRVEVVPDHRARRRASRDARLHHRSVRSFSATLSKPSAVRRGGSESLRAELDPRDGGHFDVGHAHVSEPMR